MGRCSKGLLQAKGLRGILWFIRFIERVVHGSCDLGLSRVEWQRCFGGLGPMVQDSSLEAAGLGLLSVVCTVEGTERECTYAAPTSPTDPESCAVFLGGYQFRVVLSCPEVPKRHVMDGLR